MQLIGAKVRFRIENQPPFDQDYIKFVIDRHGYDKIRVYPWSFQTGDWFTISRVSGDHFEFEGGQTTSMHYTIKEFSGDEWEWVFP